ncbi:unnamed protein product [Microthlaspi erraticum]|uniref:Uncharacterized protein n=1 Tax=Microthlaspi erraticum TaxID=1685480 RepID=A0A6D2JQX0_9BRAS|nr:unnamed protein product [Microthlaspi erraticum]
MVNRSFFFRPKLSGSPRIETNESQLYGLILQKNMVSSAKSRWFRWGLPLDTLIPSSLPLTCAFWQRPERTSLQRMKMYGDRGSPYLMPLCGWTDPWAAPLTRKA